MTWKNQSYLLWVTSALLMLSLSSCFKDHCTRTYTLYTPVYKTLTEVRQGMKNQPARALEYPGKLYIYGNYIFLNEQERGIHIIDNSNPAAPKNIAFINIPGNVDLAVKGNTLYADSWSDLVTFDISNPQNIVAKNFLNNVFPHRSMYYTWHNPNNPVNPDSVKVIVDWTMRDTTVECDAYLYLYETYYALSSADQSGSFASKNLGGGQGGSMARFTLINDYMYTVTSYSLNTFDISTPQQPALSGTINIGGGIETIYPFKDKLFIGSTNGMFIYDISSPATPVKTSTFTHATSCDPVIADDKYAYVTLRSGTTCQGFSNQLDILELGNNLANPTLIKTYSMTNPHGLAKDGNLLFICDGKDGLKIYDASSVGAINLLKKIDGIETYDVIAYDKRALVVAKDGLYQYSYANTGNITLLSKIPLNRKQ